MRVLTLALALFLVVAIPVGAQTTAMPTAGNAVAWLRTQQLPDGGFPGLSADVSSPGVSGEAALALLSAGIRPGDVSNGGAILLDYLQAQAGAIKPDPTRSSAGGSLSPYYALVAAMDGDDPTAFGGVDLLALSTVYKNPTTGLYNSTLTDHAVVVLAFAQARSPEAARAIDDGAMQRIQHADGSWSDVLSNALTIQALVASGQGGEATTRGMAWLAGAVSKDDVTAGLWGTDATSNWGDVDSTAFAIQAMIAVQADPTSIVQAQAALVTCQNADGAFRSAKILKGDDLLATTWAIIAMNSRSLVALVPG